jgi:hypothetical protein
MPNMFGFRPQELLFILLVIVILGLVARMLRNTDRE